MLSTVPGDEEDMAFVIIGHGSDTEFVLKRFVSKALAVFELQPRTDHGMLTYWARLMGLTTRSKWRITVGNNVPGPRPLKIQVSNRLTIPVSYNPACHGSHIAYTSYSRP